MPVYRAITPADRRALLDHLVSDPVSWDRQVRVDTLSDVEPLRGWLDTREAAILDVSFSECDDVNTSARDITQLCQQTSNVSYAVAKRRAERAMWLPRLPVATAARAAGHLGSAQADELCALAERLNVEQRDSLYLAENELVAELIVLTPIQARKRLLSFETDLTPEDAKDRLERQQKANRLRLTKNSDGTSSLFGHLDPLSAAYLRTALDHKVTELWRLETRNRQGDDPPDQVITDQTRRARALVELVRAGHAAGAGGRGHAEILVRIDYKTLMDDLAAAATPSTSEPRTPANSHTPAIRHGPLRSATTQLDNLIEQLPAASRGLAAQRRPGRTRHWATL